MLKKKLLLRKIQLLKIRNNKLMILTKIFNKKYKLKKFLALNFNIKLKKLKLNKFNIMFFPFNYFLNIYQ